GVTLGVAGDNLASACVSGVFVLYARETLHVPPAAYGLLAAAAAPAAIAAGLRPDLLARRLSARQVIAVCAAAQAAGWTVLAAFPGLPQCPLPRDRLTVTPGQLRRRMRAAGQVVRLQNLHDLPARLGHGPSGPVGEKQTPRTHPPRRDHTHQDTPVTGRS